MDPIALAILVILVGLMIWFVITLNVIRADIEKMSANVERLTTKNHDEVLYTIRKAIVDLKDGNNNTRPDSDSSGASV